MIDQLAAGLSDVWTLPAIITALVGGLALGWVVSYAATERPRLARTMLMLSTLAVACFWVGQITDAILGSDPHWARAVARALLQQLYVVAMVAAVIWLRRRR